jgi:hypothetical protein
VPAWSRHYPLGAAYDVMPSVSGLGLRLLSAHCGHSYTSDIRRQEGALFERLFQKALGSASRLLFAASLVMLLWGIVYAVWLLSNQGMSGPSLPSQIGWIGATLTVLAGAFTPAAQLLFGAALINHMDRWMEQRQQR